MLTDNHDICEYEYKPLVIKALFQYNINTVQNHCQWNWRGPYQKQTKSWSETDEDLNIHVQCQAMDGRHTMQR